MQRKYDLHSLISTVVIALVNITDLMHICVISKALIWLQKEEILVHAAL